MIIIVLFQQDSMLEDIWGLSPNGSLLCNTLHKAV